ncbi:MAG: hypothetical protein HQK61_03925 [Desulfamplus sp.]|nr:hypothetical protein [Desulfamplus sp.]
MGKHTDPSESGGWTAVIMERASWFITDQRCGRKNADLFKSVMKTTTGKVPEVSMGIMSEALSLESILSMQGGA